MTDRRDLDEMSILELEDELWRLKKKDKYPHLAAFIAYTLTYYYYEKENDELANRFYNDTLSLLDTPAGYGWSLTAIHMLAGMPMPHYLHKAVVIRNFPRLV